MKTAFISYASKDSERARSIKNMLEERGIACWMAPDDITPGKDYAAEIIRGIEETQATILLLSEHANASQFVKREIERAVSKNKLVLPVRLADVQPSATLELFISSAHWVDAWQEPLGPKIDLLVGSLRHVQLASEPKAPLKSLPPNEPPQSIPAPPRKKVGGKLALASGVLALLGLAVAYSLTRHPDFKPAESAAHNQPATPAVTPATAAAPSPVINPPEKSFIASPLALEKPKTMRDPGKPERQKIAPVAASTTKLTASTPTGNQPAQCSNILLKASLGEPISSSEQALLKTQCQ